MKGGGVEAGALRGQGWVIPEIDSSKYVYIHTFI